MLRNDAWAPDMLAEASNRATWHAAMKVHVRKNKTRVPGQHTAHTESSNTCPVTSGLGPVHARLARPRRGCLVDLQPKFETFET